MAAAHLGHGRRVKGDAQSLSGWQSSDAAPRGGDSLDRAASQQLQAAGTDSTAMPSAGSEAAAHSGPRQAAPLQASIITSKVIETTTTTTKTTRAAAAAAEAEPISEAQEQQLAAGSNHNRNRPAAGVSERATVQHLGRQANCSEAPPSGNRARHWSQRDNHASQSHESVSESSNSHYSKLNVDGNKFVTTISTIAAQSSQSRIVVALLKDGDKFQLKIQEMRPAIFDVGANLQECRKYFDEHQKLVANLNSQKQAPVEAWMAKYKKIDALRPNMTTELRLIYMCMAENLQGCWRGLLDQLEQRLHLLDETCQFYNCVERLLNSLDKADEHVQVYRQDFLAGPGAAQFERACSELNGLNERVLSDFLSAKRRQVQLVELIGKIAASNLQDSRDNLLVSDAQALVNFIGAYLDPLELRKLKLDSVIRTTTTMTTKTTKTTTTTATKGSGLHDNDSARGRTAGAGAAPASNTHSNRTWAASENRSKTSATNSSAGAPSRPAREAPSDVAGSGEAGQQQSGAIHTSISMRFGAGAGPGGVVKDIGNFNDLNLVDNWLSVKIEQLNSSLLSSLGVSAQDTRSILNKHEQIALECSAIEGATLNFNGKNIHAIKSTSTSGGGGEPDSSGQAQQQQQQQVPIVSRDKGQQKLFEQQRQLASRARDVITILDARIVLLRRTIDFYSRAADATSDIGKMMRRLQVDNSLQSVQFVADELELKDVSSVVASGATIISELQQLQLAQQHGQRSSIVNLNLITSGIRRVIDKLNQDLAHLKTCLNQRRLILLNEDATKMAQNFSNKCHQLKFWLDNHVKNLLLANNRLGFDVAAVSAYCEAHEEIRKAVRHKTLEVEALLRSLSTITDNFDAKSQTADEIQRDTNELRQDWICVTNCLDRRIEFARRYLAILHGFQETGRELDYLQAQADPAADSRRPRTPDERTEDDIKANIEQMLAQLGNQVANFSQEAQKSNTALEPLKSLVSASNTSGVSDINKQQIVGHANGSLKLLSERNKSIVNKLNARGPRKWTNSSASENGDTRTTLGADASSKSAPKSQALGAASKQSTTTTTNVTTIKSSGTAGRAVGNSAGNQQEAPESSEQVQARGQALGRGAPKFSRTLADLEVEPFSTIVLECELDPASTLNLAGNYQQQIKVEWLLNNKRIPANIKHSSSSEANRHRLTIGQFNPMCCGTYTARATNQLNGLSASTSCKLRLSGIREDDDSSAATDPAGSQPHVSRRTTVQQASPGQPGQFSPATSAASSFSNWRPNKNGAGTGSRDGSGPANSWQEQQQHETIKERALERIIQGVESPGSHDELQLLPTSADSATKHKSALRKNPRQQQQQQDLSQKTTTSTTTTITLNNTSYGDGLLGNKLPVTQVTYSGQPQQQPHAASIGGGQHQHLNLNYIDSPRGAQQQTGPNYRSSSSTASRSISRSPFDGTPQPPVFVQGLTTAGDSLASSRAGSRASGAGGLVCVVIGNPPPQVEWLHDGQPIASAKCARPEAPNGPRANVCKLTIETVNDQTQGQYVCRATNKLGQTTTALTLAK